MSLRGEFINVDLSLYPVQEWKDSASLCCLVWSVLKSSNSSAKWYTIKELSHLSYDLLLRTILVAGTVYMYYVYPLQNFMFRNAF